MAWRLWWQFLDSFAYFHLFSLIHITIHPMSKAEPLYRLQLIDTEIDKVAKRVREIDAAIRNNPAVNHARQELEALQKVHQRASNDQKMLDLDARSLDEKLKSEEERLYSGKIKVSKELLDVQQEIESLKRRRASLEETLLAAMMAVDESRKAEQKCAAALKQALKNWEEDNTAMRQEDQELRKRYATLVEQRKGLTNAILPSDLNIYVSIRTKKPLAVATLRNGACSACGVEPSSQMMQQARNGSVIVICPLCGRILYGA